MVGASRRYPLTESMRRISGKSWPGRIAPTGAIPLMPVPSVLLLPVYYRLRGEKKPPEVIGGFEDLIRNSGWGCTKESPDQATHSCKR